MAEHSSRRPITDTVREGLSLWRVRREDIERDPSASEAFEARRRRKLGDHATSLCAVALVAALVFWPLDWLVLGEVARGAFARWRVGVAVGSALFLALTRVTNSPSALGGAFVALTLGASTLAGDSMARAGDPGAPYVYLLHFGLLATVALPLALAERALFTAGIALFSAIGYWGLHPSHIGHAGTALWWSVALGAGLVSVWYGHSLFLLARENFEHRAALSRWAHDLEERVRERTEELRALVHQVERVREEERARIARELHDELGQEIAAIGYSLRFTRERFEKDPRAIAANLDDVDAAVERTRSLVREIVSELRPRMLDDLGLVAAVEWLARRMNDNGELRCTVRAEGPMDALSEDCKTAAFRIVQESLTNVLKHARAKEVEIDLVSERGALLITVRDDGVGIARSRGDNGEALRGMLRPGVGLIGMRERAQALSGTLDVLPRQPRGTEIRCKLPR
ncbi:MAG: sensor histidine kinase [Myxococcales bacterium]|nr:sensor histidine kinase [Myxococcales bacterium]